MAGKRVLVTGGGTYLGDAIAAALLAEGAEVTLLVRPGAEDRLGTLASRARWWTADVWNPASLKGRARGHDCVVHTVGGLTVDPTRGLTYHHLNFVSARNVANLCVSSGVSHMVLMSAARAPWLPGEYIAAKREAESYMERVGLTGTVIRAPLVYTRGRRRSLAYRLMSLFAWLPPFRWLGFRRIAPLPLDVLARGVARIALDEKRGKIIYTAADLRKRNSPRELRRGMALVDAAVHGQPPTTRRDPMREDDVPFGWTPPG